MDNTYPDKLLPLYIERAKRKLWQTFPSEGGEVYIKPGTATLTLHQRFLGETIEIPVTSAGMLTLVEMPPHNFRLTECYVLYVNEEREDIVRWDFPSGRVEPDEEPTKTAQRELYEETGIEVAENTLIPLSFSTKEDSSKPGGEKASVQYMTIMRYPEALQQLTVWRTTDYGQILFDKFVSPSLERIRLGLEPLGLTLEQSPNSLLSHSHHLWAYRKTIGSLHSKLNEIGTIAQLEI